jgi:hypothetical protein
MKNPFKEYVPICARSHTCVCGKPAVRKIEEVIFTDDPMIHRHPYTSYICLDCFCHIMGLNQGNS